MGASIRVTDEISSSIDEYMMALGGAERTSGFRSFSEIGYLNPVIRS